VNLGLGADVSNFNYTLTNPFWNETGNGTLCVPSLTLPADLPVKEGSEASLQVVTVGEDGNALYNCADIVFRADAKVLEGGECESSKGVEVKTVAGAAAVRGVNTAAAVSSVSALAVVFVFGMGL